MEKIKIFVNTDDNNSIYKRHIKVKYFADDNELFIRLKDLKDLLSDEEYKEAKKCNTLKFKKIYVNIDDLLNITSEYGNTTVYNLTKSIKKYIDVYFNTFSSKNEEDEIVTFSDKIIKNLDTIKTSLDSIFDTVMKLEEVIKNG